MKIIKHLEDLREVKVSNDREFFSATHDEIKNGATTDVYFLRTQDILKHLGIDGKVVTAEIFARRSGVFAGLPEVKNVLKDKNIEVWSIDEGETFEAKETVMRIIGPYNEFGTYETVILGMLASSCGWATAARELKEVIPDKPLLCFGARHVHPAVAPVMERAALIGGADDASCILGAKLLGREPKGTVPHAAFLIAGDTLTVAKAYSEITPKDEKITILVDTFKDEIEESLRVAEFLGDRLYGIRLDTPSERGGVTASLVYELRQRLNQKGFDNVKIIVSGGLTPERIKELALSGADAFGVGSYISDASPIDMTMDIKEVEGEPIAKRGRIPGRIENAKLKRII
ncbi:Quinolinate phosphoribosyl transferase domain-containing protein [Thermoanaerobacterium xylanolyticum LX-11]|uniref:Quinolinate phosphoribosyl transferase domain-containing protein n=1 Tax=Thermoanaerobacterium xylanolyticum (strain ATCC 49914 / DSM 7097 / LX-11) TaxID=858215 RepID=F6BHM7_THEXL|nr:nicotinate phosphoribosyltransferase [Thermoanaerobacterium xylanolyticum]AEF17626.1 Quinolinate phosphoribosyl transferase domain-containing protein [Thermoanaerobacterium xylanolyticum LX-11]